MEDVIEEIEPSEEEKRKLNETAERIKEHIKESANSLGINAEPRLVGSSARGTWISGDRDIDFFILLPKELNRDEFEEKGLRIAKKVAEHSDEYWEDYAEHPYISALFGEFMVDLVPAYNISDASEAASAVDRTPLHDEYVSNKLNSCLKRNIRLLKKYMKTIGVYGAELKTRGFSGYLNELLILYYGDKTSDNLDPFFDVIEAASKWKGNELIDLENHGNYQRKDEPLVVIDPVDPERNVAAALVTEKWSKFVASTQYFLEEPNSSFFETKTINFELSEVISCFKARGTELVALEFDKPDLVDDTLYPQLYKTNNWIKKLLDENGFDVIRSDVFSDEKKALVFFEVMNKLPNVKKHVGPPITSKNHSKEFIKKYKGADVFSGPYIKEDRWVVEKNRKNTSPIELIEEKIKDFQHSGLGKNLKRANKRVLRGPEIMKERYIDFLSGYLNKKPNWLK